MADQGIWFKLWGSSLDDPDLGSLLIADFGRWAKFGVYMKVHGTDGNIVLRRPCESVPHPLERLFQVDAFETVLECISRFPNCAIRRDDGSDLSTHASFTVKIHNWRKYQVDSSAPRMRSKRHRDAIGVTPKKRREEKRREVTEPLASPKKLRNPNHFQGCACPQCRDAEEATG